MILKTSKIWRLISDSLSFPLRSLIFLLRLINIPSAVLGKNQIQEGMILSSHGTIFTEETFDDFTVRFDFKLPPGGNNGLAIRYPGQGDTAYVGMCELQVLDNPAPGYAKL